MLLSSLVEMEAAAEAVGEAVGEAVEAEAEAAMEAALRCLEQERSAAEAALRREYIALRGRVTQPQPHLQPQPLLLPLLPPLRLTLRLTLTLAPAPSRTLPLTRWRRKRRLGVATRHAPL